MRTVCQIEKDIGTKNYYVEDAVGNVKVEQYDGILNLILELNAYY